MTRTPWAAISLAALGLAAGASGAGCGADLALEGDNATQQSAVTVAELAAEAYAEGPHQVVSQTPPRMRPFSPYNAPLKTRIHAPKEPGQYPLVMFVNCFACGKGFQEQMLRHLASHGFVVVVTELHSMGSILFTKNMSFVDADTAAEFYDWLSQNLNPFLQDRVGDVSADLSNVGMLSYSSGSKVAWIVAEQGTIPISAMAAISPVDSAGDPYGFIKEPGILGHPFNVSAPTLILGAGYDPLPANAMTPACGPEGKNHEQFFEYSPSPAWHVVAVDGGHMDTLDPAFSLIGSMTCPTGAPKEQVRSLSRGMVSAFFRATLRGETAMYDVLTDIADAPAKITVDLK